MKNLLQILLISSLFIGCSSSDDETTPEDTTPILLVKEHYLAANGTPDGSMNYTYNGDKIVKMETSDGEEKVEFTYNGDDISKSITYLDNKISEINEFFYTNGKLTSQKVINSSAPIPYNFTINYNYVNDNYVKFTRVTGYTLSSTTGVVTYTSTNYEAFLSNGNLNKMITQSTSSGTSTYTYTYDDKNSRFKNIRGYAKALIFDSADGGKGINNLVKRSRSQVLNGTTYTSGESNTYSYNSNNFPTKINTSYTSSTTPSESFSSTFEYNR